MASFLNADLPSEDEADESYDPDLDPGEAKPRAKKATGPSRRGLAANASSKPAHDVASAIQDKKRKAKAATLFAQLKATADAKQGTRSTPQAVQTPTPGPAQRSIEAPTYDTAVNVGRKRKNPDLLWMRNLGMAPPAKRTQPTESLVSRILSASTAGAQLVTARAQQSAPSPAPHATAAHAQPDVTAQAAPDNGRDPGAQPSASADPSEAGQQPVSDAAAEAAADPAARGGAAAAAPGAAQTGADAPGAGVQSAAASSAAAAAMAAIAGGALRADAAQQAGKTVLVEKRRFAGQDVEIRTEVKAGSKAAENARARVSAQQATTGLDAVLQNMSGPRKANVMDKSADDWKGYKQTNEEVQEELNDYAKSGDKYSAKQAFLSKAQASQHELERDARMAAEAKRNKS